MREGVLVELAEQDPQVVLPEEQSNASASGLDVAERGPTWIREGMK